MNRQAPKKALLYKQSQRSKCGKHLAVIHHHRSLRVTQRRLQSPLSSPAHQVSRTFLYYHFATSPPQPSRILAKIPKLPPTRHEFGDVAGRIDIASIASTSENLKAFIDTLQKELAVHVLPNAWVTRRRPISLDQKANSVSPSRLL